MHNDFKNIIFDMGGVLVGLDPGRCIRAFREVGCGVLATYVEEHRTEDLFLDTELGRITEHEFCQEVRRMAGTDTPDDRIVWAWDELLTGIPHGRLALLGRLKDEGHRLFLLSNTNTMHWQRCSQFFRAGGLDADHYFERIFLSHEMHMAKPHTEIFERALQEAALRPEDTLFVDDSADNCRAAAQLGIATLHEKEGHSWTDLLFSAQH